MKATSLNLKPQGIFYNNFICDENNMKYISIVDNDEIDEWDLKQF